MLLALRSLWEESGQPPQPTQVQGAAVLPRHVILEKLEEEAIISALLAED